MVVVVGSLFNSISTFVGNLNPIFVKGQWCYLTNNWEDKESHIFPKGISLKVNIRTWLKFELSVQHSSNYAMVSPPQNYLDTLIILRVEICLYSKVISCLDYYFIKYKQMGKNYASACRFFKVITCVKIKIKNLYEFFNNSMNETFKKKVAQIFRIAFKQKADLLLIRW